MSSERTLTDVLGDLRGGLDGERKGHMTVPIEDLRILLRALDSPVPRPKVRLVLREFWAGQMRQHMRQLECQAHMAERSPLSLEEHRVEYWREEQALLEYMARCVEALGGD